MSDFNLKDKMVNAKGKGKVAMKKDIKEFIRLLKEKSKNIKICSNILIKGKKIELIEDLCSVKDVEEFMNEIDKLSGFNELKGGDKNGTN